jgi:hypothetical protein
MPTVPNPDLAPLVGSWRLLSAGMTYADTKERIEPWGPTPVGCMVLDPGGRIMFLFTKPNRLAPTNDSERAALFDGLLSYSGLMRLDGPGRFITTVDVTAHPALGGEVLRLFRIEGDRLIIGSLEQTTPRSPDRSIVIDVVFVREHPAP